jgi:hypothetical protein
VAIEHKPKEKFEKVIGPILEDIKKMSEQKTNTKKIFKRSIKSWVAKFI